LGNFSSFGFSSVGIQRWQKPKELKYVASFSLCTTFSIWCRAGLRDESLSSYTNFCNEPQTPETR